MSAKMNFFLFLIKRYAEKIGRFTGDVLNEWNEKNITQEIFDNYWEYHQEALENAFTDIDSLITTGKHSW